MDAPWRIELLGRLRATQGDRVVTRFRARKTGVLLAYLAYYLQRPHPREALIDLLWPEADLSPGRGNLSKELSSLRHQLEPPGVPAGALIVADRYSVQLNPAACVTDVAQFESALQAVARAGSPAERWQWLAEAVQLYGGELLPGCFDDWVLQERQHLAEAHLGALRQLVTVLEQAGDSEGALEYARRAVRADPLSEETHYDLMRLYAAAGQPASALRQYQELERLLRDEMGETPSAATRALVEELRRDARTVVVARSAPREVTLAGEHSAPAPASRVDAAPLRPTRPTPRLPLQFTRFFGREEEIARLAETLLCSETRLVTLTGPGGSGKTRLAIAVGDRLQEAFREAIAFVPLADLTDADQIPDAIVNALGRPRSADLDPLEQVVEGLNRQPSLLVLDNLEHLVEEGALLVKSLLERIPTLTCLVTSRQRLSLAGEQEFVVLPLPTPKRPDTPEHLLQYASVKLFVDRAQTVRADFQVTAANAGAIAALCDRLEGLPLALELAAARAAVLTPQQMLAHLEERFDFLVSRQRGASSRHRTLRGAIDWSYELLSPDLQRFFAQLSVFRGGWTLEAAEAVCEEPHALESLEQLRECSLVLAEEVSGEARLRMLEALREYALEHLTAGGEREAIRRRHQQFFLALAEQAEPELYGREQGVWLQRLEREHDNLRVALRSSVVSGEAESGLRLGGALRRFWEVRGHVAEGRERLSGLLALTEASARTQVRVKALNAVVALADAQGDYGTARTHLEESLAIRRELGNRQDIAFSLQDLGNVVKRQGDYQAARAFHEESLAIRRELGDRHSIALSLTCLGNLSKDQGDYQAARALYEESLVIFRELGNQWGIAGLLSNLGEVALAQGKHARARARHEESLAIQRERGDQRAIAMSLDNLGNVAEKEGEYGAARALHEESLGVLRELGDKPGIAGCLEALAVVAIAQGQAAGIPAPTAGGTLPSTQWLVAARLFGAAEALREAIGVPLPPADRAKVDYERHVAAARAALGAAAFAAAWAEGRAMTQERAVAFALQSSDQS